jgi:hypothetical protein
MRNQEWDTATAELDALDLAELVLGLLVLDAVDGEATLGVVDKTEVLASLLDGDNVHESGGVGDVGADLAVDLDQALVHDRLGLTVVESILQAVTDEDDQRHAVPQLVRTSRRARGVDTRQLVEKPVRGGAKALLVLLSVRGSEVSILNLWILTVSPMAPKAIELSGTQIDARRIILLSAIGSVHLRSSTHFCGWCCPTVE